MPEAGPRHGLDQFGAPWANGASGLRIIKEIMRHAINVLDS